MTDVTPKRRVDLTIRQKEEIKDYRDENNVITHQKIAEHFSEKWNIRLARSTISGILRSDMEGQGKSPGAKRVKKCEYPHLEECLFLYFKNVRAHGIPVSSEILINQAKLFGGMLGISDLEFKYSNGWLNNFNCWLHVNILDDNYGSIDFSRINKSHESACAELTTNINKITKSTWNLDKFAFTATEFIDFDSQVPTGELLSNEDIVEIVKGGNDEDMDHTDLLDPNNIEPKIITASDALIALNLLIDFSKNNNLNFDLLCDFKKDIEAVSYKKQVQQKLLF